MLKTIDLRKEIDMAIGRFGPEAQVEKRILRSSASDANYELDFQYLDGATGASRGRVVVSDCFGLKTKKSQWATATKPLYIYDIPYFHYDTD